MQLIKPSDVVLTGKFHCLRSLTLALGLDFGAISSLTLAFGLDFGVTRRSLAEDKCISDENSG